MDIEQEKKIEEVEISRPSIFSRLMEKYGRRILVSCVAIFVVAFVIYATCISAPADFPNGTQIYISPGENLSQVISNLKNTHAIRSKVVFQSIVIMLGGEKRVIAGDYLLGSPQNAIVLASRIVFGHFDMEEVKVTVPEGFANAQIVDLLSKKLTGFDKESFLASTKNKEGYLFPDTYFFAPSATTSDIVLQMENNFTLHIASFENDIKKSGRSEDDIITMASILEAEATSTKDREIVAGILWKRLDAGMPLQVDSTLRYVTGKTSAELTVNDLKINSPYNTYIHTGLPPMPIDNPGIDAITAALNPASTDYVYFLTGTDGVMHYAKTFEEHVVNEKKYLK